MLYLSLIPSIYISKSIVNKDVYKYCDSFFPQMKPETFAKQGPELSDNEKIIFEIISKEKSMELSVLKEKSGLSNKQWDKGIKSLGKLELTKVSKNEEGLFVEFIG